ncbi:MAG: hypothetical protein HQL52_18715 [Magnetococcales bacterium]|nr:hypothetical protein [Magnetococcales bacterium]
MNVRKMKTAEIAGIITGSPSAIVETAPSLASILKSTKTAISAHPPFITFNQAAHASCIPAAKPKPDISKITTE